MERVGTKTLRVWVREGFPGGLSGKESACQCRRHRDAGLIPGSGRFRRGVCGNPLQYSCLENLINRGAWWATVHRVAQSRTWLDMTEVTWHTCMNEQGKVSQSAVLSFSRPFNTHAYLCKLFFPFGWMMNCHAQSEKLLDMSSVQNYKGLHRSLSLLKSSQNNADISLKEVTEEEAL